MMAQTSSSEVEANATPSTATRGFTAHTPGPWQLLALETSIAIYPSKLPKQLYDWRIAEMSWFPGGNGPDKDTAKANANFIVRACNAHGDLLAALKLVEKEWRECCHKDIALAADHRPLRFAMVDVRAAIAKAESQS